jgi:hypothetical protein
MVQRLQLQKMVLFMAGFLLGAGLVGCDLALPDLLPLSPTSLPPTATELPAPTSTPTETSTSSCTNKYWPVVLDATWVYELHLEGHPEPVGTETDRIIDVHEEQGLTYFSVFKSFEYVRYDPRTTIIDYYCAADGSIYSVRAVGTLLELPASSDWVPEAAWDYGDGSTKLQFTQVTTVTVPSGNFTCTLFAWVPDGTSTACWAEGVGLVQQAGSGPMVLTSYKIP